MQRIVWRGGGENQINVVRDRRAMVVLASAGGNTVEVIARLVQTSPDRVREMIHRVNEWGMDSLDSKWARGHPRRRTTEDDGVIGETAKGRPEKVGVPFSHWRIRKLRNDLTDNPTRKGDISREWLRQVLDAREVTFQRTKTWKESNDPEKAATLDRIEEVIERVPDRVFAFDEFGPLAVHPIGGCCWAAKKRPQRLRPNSHKHCGVRQFHASTPSEKTGCGVWCATTRASTTPWRPSRRSGRRAPTARGST